MTEQDHTLIRDLPRHHLERVAIRAMAEAGKARREAAAGARFVTILTSFSAGALMAAAGFMLGQLMR